MAYGKQEKPKLFTDEQMRQFVTDGYVAFIPDVAHDVHKTVMEKLQYMVDKEFNYGNKTIKDYRAPRMVQAQMKYNHTPTGYWRELVKKLNEITSFNNVSSIN